MKPVNGNSSLLGNGLLNRFPAEMNMQARIEEPVYKQQIRKHTTVGLLLETVLCIQSVQSGYIENC
jgi:spore coat protein CotH